MHLLVAVKCSEIVKIICVISNIAASLRFSWLLLRVSMLKALAVEVFRQFLKSVL